MKEKPRPFRVNVEYEDGGINSKKDARIRKAVGSYEAGGGYFFLTGTRDLGWTYCRSCNAEAAMKRIRAARIRGVRVSLEEDKD
jgi:hypothetical protein